MELDKASQRAMRTMYKATGDYGKLAKRVRQEIAKTAAVTGDTYQNIGEALYQLSSAGLSATESFAALNSVVKLAKITESDMTDTTKVVAGAYNNFKDTITGATSETEKFMKISSTLSYVWKRNQIDMNELVQGLNQSAQSGKLAGLRFEELATILGNMGTKMIRSGRAGRMFRSAVINIAQKSDEVREAFDIAFDPMKPLNFMQVMDKMKIKWDESNKSAQTTATIFSIFGKRGAPALIAMLDSWGKIRREVDGLGSAFEMAVEQHETLLRTQQHLSENLAVTGKQVFEYLTDWKDLSQHINKLLLGIRQGFTTSAVMKESRKEVVDLKKAYKDLGATQERLVELTAQQNVLRAQGAPEDVLRWYDKLILKVKAVKAGYMKEGKALKEVEDNKLSNAIANADMVLGYKKAEEAINKMNLASGHHKKSLEEMVPEIVKAREELNEAKKTYATYAALVAKDIATMPPEVKKSMADALKFYQNLVKQFFDLKNMMAKDVVSAGKAMYQQDPMKVEGRGGSEAEEAYAIQMADIKWQNTKRQMEAENELATARSDHDLTMQARNMSERESDQLKRDRAVEQLEQQDMIWAAEQAYLEEKRAVEEGALLEAEYEMDVDKVQTKLQSLNDIGVAEDELAAKRELQKVKIETAAQSYDQYQRKRIAGIYAEKGAIAASGAMWAAYGKTIGTYASSMVDQWKNMFAEMGKESKTAWKIYQGIAIAQAIVDTYKTATAGASALAGIPFVGPALAIAWVATSIASGMMRVMQIRQQKPQTAAKGGVFQGTNFEAYGTGGVTSGVATGIIGDNPSGKELVIPSENIAKNRVDGYVQPSGGGGGAPITIANLLTNEQIAGAMKSDAGENVIINAVTESNRTRGTMYRSTKETVGKR
jgi:TP901 family phage tail tape measure protein